MHHLRKNIASHNEKHKEEQTKQIVIPKHIIDACFKKPWVVYAKKPFSGVNSVVEYLGRYTHKVAISNHRITAIDKENDTVTFKYKDYKAKGIKKELTLNSMVFVRRFSLHILPKAFVRIRHFGILSSTAKTKAIETIRKQLPEKKIKNTRPKAVPYNPLQCICCKQQTMVRVMDFDQRGPPTNWRIQSKHFLQIVKLN